MNTMFDSWEAKVALDPMAKRAPAGHLLVGLGTPGELGDEGVILNHKGLPAGRRPVRSLTEYVFHASDATVRAWRRAFPKGLDSIGKLIVEDLSYDTCFAVYAFADRLLGKESLRNHPRMSAWLEDVGDWEQGYFAGEDMLHSPACLLSLLGHAYFSRQAPAKDIGDGLRSCLSFLDFMLHQQVGPGGVQFSKAAPEYRWALARHEVERQRYLLALQHGTRCQLSLPIRQSGERVLVDALILEEIELTGILKVMARTDRQHTWTKNGFGLLAFHRPGLAGTGNDMTISVDPQKGLCLKALWQRLESEENRRWEGFRPSDDPRLIESYRDPAAVQGTVAGAPNQPWWDDHGHHTLVAAPKALEPGQPGSRLEWRRDVLAALWDLYHPIPAEARPVGKVVEGTAPATASEAEPLILPEGKRLQVICWEREANLSVAQSPTFKAWLAAQSMDLAVLSPMDLPLETDFMVLEVPGGMAIPHREGLTLFDDWTSRSLPRLELETIASDLARACDIFARFLAKQLPHRGLRLLNQLRQGTFRRSDLEAWREDLAEGKADLVGIFALSIGSLGPAHEPGPPKELNGGFPLAVPLPSSAGARLRAELEAAWGMGRHRALVSELLDELARLNTQMAEEIKEKRTRSFALWGSFLGVFIGVKELGESILSLFYPEREWMLLVWLGKGTRTLAELFREDPSLEPARRSFESLHHCEIALFATAGGAALLAAYLARRLGTSVGSKD